MSHAALAGPPARGIRTGIAGGVIAGCFAIGLLAGQGALDVIGRVAVDAFKALAESHYIMYQARENLAADGAMEFAVLQPEDGGDGLRAFVDSHPGWSVRDAFVPGWSVVSVPAHVSDALEVLRGSGHVRAVLRNRGMWICH